MFGRVVPDGSFIWWRGIKNWRRGLTVGWRSNVSRMSWDIHSALGFWFFAFLLVWAISGAYFAFPDFFNTVLPSRSPDSLNDRILLVLSELHFGRFGWFTKAIWSVAGLVPASLAFSGMFVCCRRVMTYGRQGGLAFEQHRALPEPCAGHFDGTCATH